MKDPVSYTQGDVEFRGQQSVFGALYYEIVLWYPNGYYGKEDEYKFDEMRQMYYLDDHPYAFIDPKLFKHEKSCYTLAVYEIGSDGDYDIRTVGERPFNISPKDITDFVACAKFGFKYLKDLQSENSDLWE